MQLPLLHDMSMYEFFERNTRGGICSVGARRVSTANNPMCSGYDPEQSKTWLFYFDMKRGQIIGLGDLWLQAAGEGVCFDYRG